MLIQMELKAGQGRQFDENRDRKAVEIVCKIVSSVLERIMVDSRTA